MRISDDDIRKYNIKTTSNMILDKFYKVNTKTKSRFNFKLALSISSLMILATTFILVVLLFPKNTINPNKNEKETLNVNEEIFNFQVSSLVTIISNEASLLNEPISNYPIRNRLCFYRENLENDEDIFFNDAIKEYQLFEDVIYNKYYEINSNILYNYNDYQGYYNDYKLMLDYNDYKIYINYINKEDEESEFEGEIEINGKYYKLEGKEEKEIDELELSTKIYLSDEEYYLVEEEYENDEYSYKYSIKLNNKEKCEYKLKIENENISFKVESNDKRYEYDIEVLDDKNWSFKFNGDDKKFEFNLEIDNEGKKNYNKK